MSASATITSLIASRDALVARLAAADFNVHIHAIGDRAVRMSLDAFEAARGTTSARRLRHRAADGPAAACRL